MKISKVLAFSFGIITIGLIAFLTLSIGDFHNAGKNAEKLYMHPFTVSSTILKIEINILKMHRAIKNAPLANTDEELEKIRSSIRNYENFVYEELKIVRDRFLGNKSKVEELELLFNEWKPIREEIIYLIKNNQTEKATFIIQGKETTHVQKLEDYIHSFMVFAHGKADSFYEESLRTNKRALITINILIFMTIPILIFLTINIKGKGKNIIIAIIVFTLIITIISITNLNKTRENTEKLYLHPFTVSMAILEIDSHIIKMHIAMKDIIIAKNKREINDALIIIKGHEECTTKHIETIKERFLGDKSRIKEFEIIFKKMEINMEEIISLIEKGETKKAITITKEETTNYVQEHEEYIQGFMDFAKEKADSFYIESLSTSKKALIASYLLIIITTLTVIFLPIIIYKMIITPLSHLSEGVELIRKGNLNHKIKIESRNEIGELAIAFNKMANELYKSKNELQYNNRNLEKTVAKRTKELEKKIEELQIFNKITVNRELKMVEFKKRIEELEKKK